MTVLFSASEFQLSYDRLKPY